MEVKRPPLRYFGGKWNLAPWIISHFPPHRIYVEPYGGGASVLFRKQRSKVEVYNDLYEEVVEFFRVLRDPEKAKILEDFLRNTPFARAEYDLSYQYSMCEIERARRMIIRSLMGHGPDTVSNTRVKHGFRANSNGSGTSPAADWVNYPPTISQVSERLRGVVIDNRNGFDCMYQHDSKETLHYVDPPYLHGTRKEKLNYDFEMTYADHRALVDVINQLEGMVVLSGYDNELYQSLGWASHSRKASADGGSERVEKVWMNLAAERNSVQIELDL